MDKKNILGLFFCVVFLVACGSKTAKQGIDKNQRIASWYNGTIMKVESAQDDNERFAGMLNVRESAIKQEQSELLLSSHQTTEKISQLRRENEDRKKRLDILQGYLNDIADMQKIVSEDHEKNMENLESLKEDYVGLNPKPDYLNGDKIVVGEGYAESLQDSKSFNDYMSVFKEKISVREKLHSETIAPIEKSLVEEPGGSIATKSLAGKVTIEILNGSGKKGIASRVAKFLEKRGGYVVKKIGNASSFKYESTRAYYKSNHKKSASELSDFFSDKDIIVEPRDKQNCDITLIIGRNF